MGRNFRGFFVHFLGDVGVCIKRSLDGRVPQSLLNNFIIDAAFNKKRGMRVPERVK